VRINALGFRDPRDYSLAKPPGTFRILVLGDSVTFGHGAVYDTTYPYLLETKLKAWRPDVRWEVWNLGVPGYNTAQELAYLRQIGAAATPDLAIVGFFANDFTGFEPPMNPSLWQRAASGVIRTMQRHVYSTELYKRVYLTVRWRWFESPIDRQRLEHLDTEDALLGRADADQAVEQRLGDVERFSDEAIRSFECVGVPRGGSGLAIDIDQQVPYLRSWLEAVDQLQALHRSGAYRIMFFVNMAPRECPGADRYFDHGTFADNEAVLEVLGRGTPAVSSLPEFLHYRPSQMPGALGHSVGNANLVKANALFEYLRDTVLPPLVPAPAATP
jgi:lysophospholipase L1-like esterase